jgi:hypothetical protein
VIYGNHIIRLGTVEPDRTRGSEAVIGQPPTVVWAPEAETFIDGSLIKADAFNL